jgi:hypothetical protein
MKLGQLFHKLDRPDVRIAEPEYIPESAIPPDRKYNWKWTHQYSGAVSMSLSARLLAQFLGLGPDIAGSGSSRSVVECSTSLLETYQFEPDENYVQSSMNAAAVCNFLAEHKPASLYMITGLKIARSPAMRELAENEFSGKLGASWDTAPISGVPVSGDASVSRSSTTGDTQEYENSGDLVLAVKINQILTSWGYPTGKTKEVLRGTVLDNQPSRPSASGDEASEDGSESDEEKEERMVGYRFLDEDATVGNAENCGFNISYKECMGDDNVGECILLSLN